MDKIIPAIQEIFKDIGNQIIDAIPNVVIVLFFLIVSLIVASLLAGITRRLLTALKADKVSKKLQDVELFKSLNFKLSVFLSKLVYWLTLLIFLIAVTDKVGLTTISDGISSVLAYIPRLLSAFVCLQLSTFRQKTHTAKNANPAFLFFLFLYSKSFCSK